MNILKLSANYLLKGMLFTILITLINSCAKKAIFQPSSVVPAARGSVKVKKDDNKNYLISVKILNLAEPERLQPPKKSYVVWMVTDENVTKNLGQIETSTKFLSKSLQGFFKTATSLKPVRVFITAEDEAVVEFPSMNEVLTTSSF